MSRSHCFYILKIYAWQRKILMAKERKIYFAPWIISTFAIWYLNYQIGTYYVLKLPKVAVDIIDINPTFKQRKKERKYDQHNTNSKTVMKTVECLTLIIMSLPSFTWNKSTIGLGYYIWFCLRILYSLCQLNNPYQIQLKAKERVSRTTHFQKQ